MKLLHVLAVATAAALVLAGQTPVVVVDKAPAAVDKWVEATGRAAGTDEKARDEAVAQALRTAVEEACGVFLTGQSKTTDYKAVYDKVLANSVGYVREHKVSSVAVEGGVTTAKVRARVSTRKFEEDWASIAHTVNQENNPRLIVAVVESVHQVTTAPATEVKENGVVQARIEDFFITKGLTLMDKGTAAAINKRDVLLAALKDDPGEVAALGSKFNADVVVTGRAEVKYGKTLRVADTEMYQYVATLTVRVIQTDSARVLASKSFKPVTVTTLQKGGGEDKALGELADKCSAELLSSVIEAWKNRANASRTVNLSVSAMDYAGWKKFKDQAEKLRGVKALRLRGITKEVAEIDVEYMYSNESLADHLIEIADPKLTIQEITANRIKLTAQVAKTDE